MTSSTAATTLEWGFPEIKLGCFPPVACTALAALVGHKRAAEMILTGASIDGREAAASGLATRAASEQQLDSALHVCVGQLLRLSPAALAVAKKANYAWDSMHFDKGLARAEKVYFEELMKTADAQEGIRAFLEKRPPKSGREIGLLMDYEITPEEVKSKVDAAEPFMLLMFVNLGSSRPRESIREADADGRCALAGASGTRSRGTHRRDVPSRRAIDERDRLAATAGIRESPIDARWD